MKKLVALLLFLSSPVYALSDCADKPTCEEIGYTHNEYACDQKIAMPCPFDSSKIYCPGPICEPGYFLYSDGSCSLALKSDKTVIGIVFNKEQRLAVSVGATMSLQWANNAEETLNENGQETIVVPGLYSYLVQYETTCTECCNGRENTKKIIDFAKANNYVFPAAEYCYNFATSGKGKGSWWLPSNAELRLLFNERDIIDAALEKSGAEQTKKESHWTSNTALNTDGTLANFYRPSTNLNGSWNKRVNLFVKCVTRY